MTETPRKVSLFVTCLVDTLFPDVGQAAADVLEAQGITVEVPEGQTCCGQPAFNGGYWDEARKMARHTIDTFGDSNKPVIVPSGSCGAMVIHYYEELFHDDPVYGPKAQALAARTVEFTAFLVDVLDIDDVGATADREIVFHPSCHGLRGLHIDQQPRTLLDNIDGLSVAEQSQPQTCCGFGGVFSVKMGAISEAMMNERIDAFEATGAECVVGGDVSCLMHLEGGLRKRGSAMRTMHIAQLLADGIDS